MNGMRLGSHTNACLSTAWPIIALGVCVGVLVGGVFVCVCVGLNVGMCVCV